MKPFGDYDPEKEKWISFVATGFYPNHLKEATEKYSPLVTRFGELLNNNARTSQELYLLIMQEPKESRTQLLRIFKKYVSPDTSVEMTKRVGKANEFIRNFGARFRSIEVVRERFEARPKPDESLIALLREYEDRGEKGYELTSTFFNWFKKKYGKMFILEGPERAGKDIELKEVFPNYPSIRPVDFIIRDLDRKPLVVGFGRYDSDRGGSQEDDRTGGYGNAVSEIFGYSDKHGLHINIVFLNDGPGLLLGSMWRDYASLEDKGKGRIMVTTLKMLDERLTEQWIRS